MLHVSVDVEYTLIVIQDPNTIGTEKYFNENPTSNEVSVQDEKY